MGGDAAAWRSECPADEVELEGNDAARNAVMTT